MDKQDKYAVFVFFCLSTQKGLVQQFSSFSNPREPSFSQTLQAYNFIHQAIPHIPLRSSSSIGSKQSYQLHFKDKYT